MWVRVEGFSKVVVPFNHVGGSFNLFMATTRDVWIIPSFRIQNTEYRILYCHFDHTCHVSKGTTGNKVHNYIQHIRRLKTSYTCIVQIRTMWLRLLKKKQKNDLEHIIDIWKVIQWYYTYKTLTRSKYIQLINMCYHCNRSGFTQVGSWGQTLLHIEIC